MLIDSIGLISSICTIVLFVFYFIGKILVNRKISFVKSSNVKAKYITNIYRAEQSRPDIKDIIKLDDQPNIQIEFEFPQPVISIRIYESKWSNHKNDFVKRGRLKYKCSNLFEGSVIRILADIPELEPGYLFEYRKLDYSIGRITIICNMKDSGINISEEYRRDILSYLYYLTN